MMGMAEFCPDCFSEVFDCEFDEKKYILSKHLELCEGCGEYKQVVLMERSVFYSRIFEIIIYPLKFLISILLWIVFFPYFFICI